MAERRGRAATIAAGAPALVLGVVLLAACAAGGEGESGSRASGLDVTTGERSEGTGSSPPSASSTTPPSTAPDTTASPTTGTVPTTTAAPTSAVTASSTSAVAASRSIDLRGCTTGASAGPQARTMRLGGRPARVSADGGVLLITTDTSSAELGLPADWTFGTLETTLDLDGDGTDELVFTTFGNTVLIAAVMALDGCELVELDVLDDTAIEPQLLHGAGGNSCIGCEETLYCTPLADGRTALNQVSSIPINRLLDDDYTLDEYDEWLDSSRERQYVVRHHSWRDGAVRLDYEEWDWRPEATAPWPSTNRVEPCTAPPATATEPLPLDETGLPGILAWGATPADALEALTARLGPPTHDTGWSAGDVSFCDSGLVRTIAWGDLRLVFTDARFGSYAAGLIQIVHTRSHGFEDGFSGPKPVVWPAVVTDLAESFGTVAAGAVCLE